MNLRLTTILAAAAVFTVASAQDKTKPSAAPAAATAATDADPMAGVPMDKVSYFIGRNIGKNMAGQGFHPDLNAFKEGAEFLATNGKRKGVTTTDTGLQYEVMKAAEGPKPKKEDKVKVHYHGTLIDGKVFDSSVDRKEPATFPLSSVIPGWTEGVQLMNKGSKFKFFIPAKLAYGEQGQGAIGPNATLVFEDELLDINPADAPPAAGK